MLDTQYCVIQKKTMVKINLPPSSPAHFKLMVDKIYLSVILGSNLALNGKQFQVGYSLSPTGK